MAIVKPRLACRCPSFDWHCECSELHSAVRQAGVRNHLIDANQRTYDRKAVLDPPASRAGVAELRTL
jgi:hypothetical protein